MASTAVFFRRSARPVAADGFVPSWRVTVIGVLTLLVVLGQLYLVLPMLGQLARLPGASAGSGALGVTAFALPYALGFLVLGPLTDRYGPRRVMVGSVAVVLAGSVAAAMAPDWNWFLAARAMQGFGAAPFTPATLLVVAVRVRPAHRLVVTSAIISAGMAAAVVAQVAAQLGSPVVGPSGMFLLSAAAMAGCLLLVLLLLPVRDVGSTPGVASAKDAAPARVGDVYRAIPRLLARPRLVLLFAVALSYLTVFVGLYAALQLAGPVDLAGDPGQLLLVRAGALPAMIAVPVMTPLLVRLPARPRLLGALGAAAVATASLGLLWLAGVQGVAVLVLGMLVVAAAIAIAAPATVTEVMAAAGPAAGAANALYSAAIFGGASLGTPLAAVVIALAGPATGFGAFALTCTGCLVVALALAAVALRSPAG